MAFAFLFCRISFLSEFTFFSLLSLYVFFSLHSVVMADKKALEQAAAVTDISAYMQEQNRPYSVVDVHTNMRGKFGKALVVRALEQLAEEKVLIEKVIGKQKLYYANQSRFAAVDDDEIKRLDTEIAERNRTLTELKHQLRTADSALKSLQSAPTTEELRSQKVQLEAEVTEKRDRAKQLAATTLTEEDVNRKKQLAEEQYKLSTEAKKRKRLATQMLDSILENVPKKKKDLVDEIGVELDEE